MQPRGEDPALEELLGAETPQPVIQRHAPRARPLRRSGQQIVLFLPAVYPHVMDGHLSPGLTRSDATPLPPRVAATAPLVKLLPQEVQYTISGEEKMGTQPRTPTELFVVRLERGGPWDWSRDLREQASWAEHAAFMDGLVDEGFILLGGPLEGGHEVLHAVAAASEQVIRDRLSNDVWSKNGMLTIKSIELWTILLDGRG